jgi:hypothetical protein
MSFQIIKNCQYPSKRKRKIRNNIGIQEKKMNMLKNEKERGHAASTGCGGVAHRSHPLWRNKPLNAYIDSRSNQSSIGLAF